MAFDFIAEYRNLQPTEDRELVAARMASFEDAAEDVQKSISRVVDLAYFAYRMPLPTESDAASWFGGILTAHDPTFRIEIDIEEAARIATLLLKQRLVANYYGTPVIVHAASFAGKRQTVDNHGLSYAARQTLSNLVRLRGSSVTRPDVASGKAANMSDWIKKLSDDNDPTLDVQVFEAAVNDYRNLVKQVVSSTNNALETVWSENRRLAEEVDLLWWHLGGHSVSLDRAIADIPTAFRPIVIGMDIGEMVSAAPGPYGTYGIIRKALGELADEKFKLSDAVKELSDEFAGLISRPVSRYAAAPIHGAVGEVLLDGTPVVAAQFKRRTGLSFDVKLNGYELAVQAYHERMLNKLGWV